MRVLIVEDDARQAGLIEEALFTNFTDVSPWRLRDERSFRRAITALREEPPSVVIMDLMLRWADPEPDLQEPPLEVLNGGFYRAGLRCLTLLLRYPETQHIPVIIYSVLERAEVVQELEKLPPHVFFLRKDVDDAVLVRHLGSVFAALATEPSHAFSWASRLWQSLEVKPGWLGVGIDLKRLLGVNRPGRKSK